MTDPEITAALEALIASTPPPVTVWGVRYTQPPRPRTTHRTHPTPKEPPMNHKKKLLATTAVAVAATIAAPTSADAQLIDEALS